MADDMEVPMDLYSSVPDDVDGATKLYMRAQVVIQGAFYSLGNRDISPGEATMENGELEEILGAALAMLVAADPALKTKRDVRLRIESHAKHMRAFAEALKEAGDKQVLDVLDILRLRRTAPN